MNRVETLGQKKGRACRASGEKGDAFGILATGRGRGKPLLASYLMAMKSRGLLDADELG